MLRTLQFEEHKKIRSEGWLNIPDIDVALAKLYAELDEEEENEAVKRIVRSCVANQAFEGMECSEEDVAAIRRIASGETTAEQEVAQILSKYQKEE